MNRTIWNYIWGAPAQVDIEARLGDRLAIARNLEATAAEIQRVATDLQQLADEIRRLP